MKPSELLNSPDKWTKGSAAKTKDGIPIYSGNPEAYSFCLYGALNKCFESDTILYDINYNKIRDVLKSKFLSGFNDAPKTTYEDIINVLKKCDL